MIEKKTDGQIYQEIKDLFEQHGGIDYNNRCNVQRVRVEDEINFITTIIQACDDERVFEIQKRLSQHCRELSQSNGKDD